MLMSSLFHSAIVEQNIRKKLFCFENNTIHFLKKKEKTIHFPKKECFVLGNVMRISCMTS